MAHKIVRAALLLVLCAYMVHHCSAVHSSFLKNFYSATSVEKFIDVVFKRQGEIKLPGRGGSVFLPTNYFDGTCDREQSEVSGADICFIVQTSCRCNKKDTVLKDVIKDINFIIKGGDSACPDVTECGSYTIVTYDDKATNIGKNVKKIKPGKKCADCKARTDLALDECKKYFEKKPNDTIPDVIVVFNDGISFDTKCNTDYARMLTIQKALDIKRSGSCASRVVEYPPCQPVPPGNVCDPNDEWALLRDTTPPSFGTLPTTPLCILPNLGQPFDVPTEPCSGRKKREGQVCTGTQADVAFLIDSSGSIAPTNFILLKEFVKSVVADLDIGPTNVQVAAISFSSTVRTEFDLNTYSTTSDVLSAIDAITQIFAGTNTNIGLDHLISSVYTTANGDRPTAPNVAFVLTDGASNDPVLTAASALAVQNAGISVFAIGIGNNQTLNMAELNAIASDPDFAFVKIIGDFITLPTITEEVALTICRDTDLLNEIFKTCLAECLGKLMPDIITLYNECGFNALCWADKAGPKALTCVAKCLEVSQFGEPPPRCPTDDASYGGDKSNPTVCCKVDNWYSPKADGTYTTQQIPTGTLIDRTCPNGTVFVMSSYNDCGCIHVIDICTGEDHNEAANLKCPFGDSIAIKKVTYGRTNTAVCVSDSKPPSDHANVNCIEQITATDAVKDECQGKSECTVGPQLLAEFTDPGCNSTYKYINVQFECITKELCCYADIMLVIDQSNSILKEDIKTMHGFWHDFIEEQRQILHPKAITRNRGLQFGIITYGGYATRHAKLGEYDQVGLMNLIKNQLPKGTTKFTSTHEALKMAKDELFNNGRSSSFLDANNKKVRKIVLLATDGRTWKRNANNVCDGPNNCTETLNAAQDIKDLGGEIYVIGEPNHKDRNDGYEREWQFMASEPINCTIVNMQNNTPPATYNDLQFVGIHLTKEFCTQGRTHPCTLPEYGQP